MGLTIHYSFYAGKVSSKKAKEIVSNLRQCALDLPFSDVSLIYHTKECNYEKWRGTGLYWPLIQAQTYVKCGQVSFGVTPRQPPLTKVRGLLLADVRGPRWRQRGNG